MVYTVARIEVDCSGCGSLLLRGQDFLLRRWEGTPTYYLFSCTRCHRQMQRRADAQTVEILLAEGARLVSGDAPAELLEPRNGPPISEADASNFTETLADPRWLERLIASMYGVAER